MNPAPTSPVRPRRRGRGLAVFLAVFGVLLALLYWTAGIPLSRARALLAEGDVRGAAEEAGRWSRLHLRSAEYDQLRAAALLAQGDDTAAQPILERAAARRPPLFPAIGKDEVARLLVSRGRYREFLLYDAAFRQRFEPESVVLYRAASHAGEGRLDQARTLLAGIDRDDVEEAQLSALEATIARRSEGSYPLILDRKGQPIAIYQVENRDLVAVNADFTTLVDRSGGPFSIEASLRAGGTANVVQTTLDPRMQRAALAALGDYRGSIVVIDVASGELLAVASTAGEGEAANLAFGRQYEPGSIVKVLTGLAAFEDREALGQVFPLECEGFTEIDGRQFYDWARHGSVPTIEEAMAVSCNVAFARLGLALKRPALDTIVSRARFEAVADLELMRVPLGKKVKPVDHDFMLANYAIGLEVLTTNALHVAMIANAIANGGDMVTPKLVRERRSILGEPVGSLIPTVATPLASDAAVKAILPSLRAVVTNPRGSGRRAALPGIPLAMKTGTAGGGEGRNYDAVVMAFAPADQPRLAIGLVAEKAGPAELAGATITREFFALALDTP